MMARLPATARRKFERELVYLARRAKIMAQNTAQPTSVTLTRKRRDHRRHARHGVSKLLNVVAFIGFLFLIVAPTRAQTIIEERPDGKGKTRHYQRNQTGTMEAAPPPAFAPTIQPAVGDHRTLVVLVNFANLAQQPFTTAQVQAVFQASANFFVEVSYDKTSVFGDIVGWFTLPIANVCSDFRIFDIQLATDGILQHSGFDPSNYQHIAYVFPSGGCDPGILGWAEVGGRHSWYNGSLSEDLASHELGHNFGLDHSHSIACQTSGCTVSEYGDSWDTMGFITGAAGHYNSLQKERLGWLTRNDLDALIGEVKVGQLVTLAPYETITRGELKAVKVSKGVNLNGHEDFYYLEYRAGVGVDSGLPAAVLVHVGNREENNSTYLWDLDGVGPGTHFVLNTGQSYHDDLAGLSIVVLSGYNISGAVVSVTFTDGAPNKPQARKRARFN